MKKIGTTQLIFSLSVDRTNLHMDYALQFTIDIVIYVSYAYVIANDIKQNSKFS